MNYTAVGDYQHIAVKNIQTTEKTIVATSETYVTDKKGNQYDVAGADGVYTYNVNMAMESGYLTVPKINYANYAQVTMDWEISGYVFFGYGTDLWYYPQGPVTPGTLTMVVADGVMTVTFDCKLGTHSITVTDADIINGNKSFAMNYTAVADYQHVAIKNIQTTEISTRPTFEGAQIARGETLVDATIDGNSATFAVQNGVDGKIYLPCIDYTKYQVVMFDWVAKGGWIPFTISGADWYFNSGVEYYGTATLTYTNGTLTVVMNSPVDGGGERKVTITDVDIINGVKPVVFNYSGWAGNNIVFSNLQVWDDAISMAGAQIAQGENMVDATVNGNNATYAVANGKDGNVYFGAIDFTKYTKVAFEWNAKTGWLPFGVPGDDWYYNNATHYYGTAEITYDSETNSITVVMTSTVSGGGTRTATITDAEIISGQKPLALKYMGWSNGSIVITDVRAMK